ncbi:MULTISPECIES: hypothetical protein [Enterobacterales]|jgi:hypothetical protein|uniref:hypothetical protein n=1 Tax=Enterobacterales TaxID=91347 RepID=UPI000CDD1F8D|nr:MULTISPECIES: hypothetical protein [Enterobacterales]EDQ1662033.1 hypothetical protein [Salmonella enterica subsp. enterica serovar Livingstone]MCC3736038.1 hypothetical protein [Rouxiella badensis]MCC3761440.1 hypothetical protein [Rouxiella badensis]POU47048.1 hypothetical protein C3401_26015 [Serratia sp. SSNIH4]POW32408.1 hypothetical protein C3396_26000 [Serratia sp. SSNIH5]
MKIKDFITGLTVIALCNGVGFGALYLSKKYLFHTVTFKDNLGNLGSSLVTYSTAMMALLIAMVVVIFGLDGPRLDNFKKGGYLHTTYFIYMITFLELGVTMCLSLLCLSNIQSIKVASYSLTFSMITFLLIGFLGIQLLNIKKNN